MGRLIDADKVIEDMQYYYDDCEQTSVYTRLGFETAMEVVKDAPTVEAIPKADYEARLKADMMAMLEELISEAIELEDPKYILEMSELPLDVDGTTLPLETYAMQCYCRGGEEVIDIIEKKIGELREGVKEKPKSCSTCRSYKGHAGHCEICHEMSMYKEKSEEE